MCEFIEVGFHVDSQISEPGLMVASSSPITLIGKHSLCSMANCDDYKGWQVPFGTQHEHPMHGPMTNYSNYKRSFMYDMENRVQ